MSRWQSQSILCRSPWWRIATRLLILSAWWRESWLKATDKIDPYPCCRRPLDLLPSLRLSISFPCSYHRHLRDYTFALDHLTREHQTEFDWHDRTKCPNSKLYFDMVVKRLLFDSISKIWETKKSKFADWQSHIDYYTSKSILAQNQSNFKSTEPTKNSSKQ